MKIWIVSMECAGIIEAGGVKDVTYSLCKNFAKQNNEVTLFIPVFKTNSFSELKNIKKSQFNFEISSCNAKHKIFCDTADFKDFSAKVVLINHEAFFEKQSVYVYTEEEQIQNPNHKAGKGHEDFQFLDVVLSKSVCEFGTQIAQNKLPDVVHCQDASTAITPCYMDFYHRNLYKHTLKVVTIHNAGASYHHEFFDIWQASFFTELPWNDLLDADNHERIEPFLLASKHAHLTTVSSYYASELLDKKNDNLTDGLSSLFIQKNIQITGITNGIDYENYCPENIKKSLLPYKMNPTIGDLDGKLKCKKYFLKLCQKDNNNKEFENYTKNLIQFGYLSKSPDAVFFVYHGRIVGQKGISLLIKAMKKINEECDCARFIIMGQGDVQIENDLCDFVKKAKGKAVYFKGYNAYMARLCIASAEFSVLPSNFEPCCLEDFISQIYGTLPIAHATGGLKKIIDGETGFLYEPNSVEELENAIKTAINFKINDYEIMKVMIRWAANFVKEFCSWEVVSKNKYLKFFQKNIKFLT